MSVAALLVAGGCANLIGADFDSKRVESDGQGGTGGETDVGAGGTSSGGTPSGGAVNGGSGGTLDEEDVHLVINEVAAGNGSEFIELYNKGSLEFHLGEHALFTNSTELIRFSPDVRLAPQAFVVIWRYPAPSECEGKCNVYAHTSIAEGDRIEVRVNQEVIDSAELPSEVSSSGSYGRLPDGTGSFVLLDEASPGAPNYVP